jgi:hypothetical protein
MYAELMEFPWTKKRNWDETAVARLDDLAVEIPGVLDAEAAQQLIKSIAKRDSLLVKKMESLAEENRDLKERTGALETALARIIQNQGGDMVRMGSDNDEGSQLVRRHMGSVDRGVL